ncbi:NAD(P)/FAD-dependent oxidoreductase [Alistipes sp. ZOR0009]|uniref:NAD(P)/FAD-dependent oxidoreductase n=1 Tax=Alistipes sp. ZOR0009 TaxID=1339253 RepID=UPI0009DEACC2|nr:NAD(P)/FAD-dependent oxidoreductase [Alistipes sp. ZOR0009]
MSTTSIERIRCLILGDGPAVYTAAINAAHISLSPLVYEGLMMDEMQTFSEIASFHKHPKGTTKVGMMENLRNQAICLNVDIRLVFAVTIDFAQQPFKVTVDEKKEMEVDILIIANGSKARYYGIDSDRQYCEQGGVDSDICDGFFYKGQDVVVVGADDIAAEQAFYLATICRKVYLVVCCYELLVSKTIQKSLFNTPNIEVLWGYQIREVLADELGVNGVLLVSDKKEEKKVHATGLFVAIDH